MLSGCSDLGAVAYESLTFGGEISALLRKEPQFLPPPLALEGLPCPRTGLALSRRAPVRRRRERKDRPSPPGGNRLATDHEVVALGGDPTPLDHQTPAIISCVRPADPAQGRRHTGFSLIHTGDRTPIR